MPQTGGPATDLNLDLPIDGQGEAPNKKGDVFITDIDNSAAPGISARARGNELDITIDLNQDPGFQAFVKDLQAKLGGKKLSPQALSALKRDYRASQGQPARATPASADAIAEVTPAPDAIPKKLPAAEMPTNQTPQDKPIEPNDLPEEEATPESLDNPDDQADAASKLKQDQQNIGQPLKDADLGGEIGEGPTKQTEPEKLTPDDASNAATDMTSNRLAARNGRRTGTQGPKGQQIQEISDSYETQIKPLEKTKKTLKITLQKLRGPIYLRIFRFIRITTEFLSEIGIPIAAKEVYTSLSRQIKIKSTRRKIKKTDAKITSLVKEREIKIQNLQKS